MMRQVVAALDGLTSTTLMEGEEYDVPDDIAEVYISDGRAREVKPRIVVVEEDEKAEKRMPRQPGPKEIK